MSAVQPGTPRNPAPRLQKQPQDGVGLVQTQYLQLPEDLPLDCGQYLERPVLAYETYGQLNERRDNVILVAHALSGDAHAAGYHSPEDRKPGWWDVMIGPGKALDTNRFFVVCSNVIGGCRGSTGPCSPRPDTGRPYGSSFPRVTVGDMVRAQARLLDQLGIETLHAVVGGSMGGMQVLEWVTAYPGRVRKGICIASTVAHSAQQIAFNEAGRQAIMNDPLWQGGDYYGTEGPWRGLAVARMVGHITYLSEEAMEDKFGRAPQGDPREPLDPRFAVEHYLQHQGNSFVQRFDANTYLYVTRAIDDYHLGDGAPESALARAQAEMQVIAFTSDWLYPAHQSRHLVQLLRGLNQPVRYDELDSSYGHDSFLIENPPLAQRMQDFLTGSLRVSA